MKRERERETLREKRERERSGERERRARPAKTKRSPSDKLMLMLMLICRIAFQNALFLMIVVVAGWCGGASRNVARPVAPGSGKCWHSRVMWGVNSGRGTVQGEREVKVASRGGCPETARRDLIELEASLLPFDALVDDSAVVMSTVSNQVSPRTQR
ncbi:hypothetical protein B0H65DRAFT_136231 [Neurospora tetraspora]|uniref:Uncharacterized protein n=1 Tax=Neurospora tetraspora TaxID=94610 RepID=A0AAE0MUU3_9PEZI|nr:hypothetical protein B0H65DRAFT_136231 [Neurospora tetraspora]